MTSLSGIKVPLPRIVLLVNATFSWDHDSEIRVTTGLVASFVGYSSVSSLRVGVGAATGTDDGAACGDEERRLGG